MEDCVVYTEMKMETESNRVIIMLIVVTAKENIWVFVSDG